MTARLLVGDVFDRMAELPDGSVDLILTSPPFLALRSYLPDDHPDKGKEIGSEPTPAAFIDTLLRLTAEWRRLLAPHGSIAVELGDTYSGSGGAGGDYGPDGLREGQPKFRQQPPNKAERYNDDGTVRTSAAARATEMKNRAQMLPLNGGPGWPLEKSLCLIPELYRIALVYGVNPLTGGQSPAGRWRARNVVRWCRPNPPVGALGDKFRPATTDMVIACTARDRYFDLDAVRTPFSEATIKSDGYSRSSAKFEERQQDANGRPGVRTNAMTHAGAPPLDWWDIPTQPYKGSHYATWPEALCIRPILAMSPQRVCVTCGKPSRRITETVNALGKAAGRRSWRENGTDGIGAGHVGEITESVSRTPSADVRTLGWSDCGHNSWRPGHVLDPFAGSGTTLAVAQGHGRQATGIDLDPRNADLIYERVGGMFLTIDQPKEATA